MKYLVEIHYQNGEPVSWSQPFTHVANITVDAENVNLALEEAYFHTQNLNGSWSRGPTFEDGSVNEDYFEGTEVLVPLEVYEGKVYGHRSSMMDDMFVINGERYIVDFIGFQKEGE